MMPAFKGAVGHGRNSVGGQGGTVLYVTNLNDSGAGSFRDACGQTGARIVVFQVAGDIILRSVLRIANPFLTIAGQTAPGDGICIRGMSDQGYVRVATNDVIIRGMRFRNGIFYEGDTSHQNIYDIDIVEPSFNVIVDHCSFSFSDDTAVNIWKHCYNITVQNSIIAYAPWESLNFAGPTTGAAPGERISAIRNLLAHGRRRNPNSNYAIESEFCNNVVLNPRTPGGDIDVGTRMDYRGNVYLPGENTVPGAFYQVQEPTSEMAIFQEGNFIVDGYSFATGLEGHTSPTPVGSSGYEVMPWEDVVDYVEVNAGALPHDAIDTQVIGDMLNGTGHWILHPREIGGYPVLTGTPRTQAEWEALVLAEGGVEEAMESFYPVEIERFYLLVSPLNRSYRLPVPFLIHASVDAVSARVVVESEVLTLPFFVSSDPDLKIATGAWMPTNKRPRTVTATVDIRFSDDTTETLPPVTFTIAKSPNSIL